MNKLALLFTAAVLTLPALAQDEGFVETWRIPYLTDELVPDTPLMTNGKLLRRDVVLMHHFQAVRRVDRSVIVVPTWSKEPEYALGLSGERVAVIQLKWPLPKPISNELFEAAVRGSHTNDLETVQCSIMLDRTLAGRLAEIWDDMLARTRYPLGFVRESFLGSADEYHFALIEDDLVAAGLSLGEELEKKPGMLEQIIRSLRDYCMTKDQNYVSVVEITLGHLEAELKSPESTQ